SRQARRPPPPRRHGQSRRALTLCARRGRRRPSDSPLRAPAPPAQPGYWGRLGGGRRGPLRSKMPVKSLYALQNGFIGFATWGLFYGERPPDRVAIPVTCYAIRTGDATILFDTGISPRAVPGLMRRDLLARFAEEDLLVHRLDTLGLDPRDID